MKVAVVAVVNRRPKEPYYHFETFLESLRRFSAEPVILGLDEEWRGLMTKPRRLRKWLRDGRCDADLLIVSDAFDVVFAAPPEEVADEVLRRFETVGAANDLRAVVFNAEKGLFPRGELAHRFPPRCLQGAHDAVWDTCPAGAGPCVASPWRYLNSGVFAGEPEKILALLEAMWLDDIHDDVRAIDALHCARNGNPGDWVNPNDQGWYQTAFAAQPVEMVLDSGCLAFQCLSGCALDEFDLAYHPHRILNRTTGTTPLVWHFNGGAKNELMPLFLAKWGLPA